ncbi:MAG: hypothetical protein M1814_003325 [Vezdaea aestivalis]|nr:MAG: hypothetical protein M1814_003325 [Vezdaea aestivalis]
MDVPPPPDPSAHNQLSTSTGGLTSSNAAFFDPRAVSQAPPSHGVFTFRQSDLMSTLPPSTVASLMASEGVFHYDQDLSGSMTSPGSRHPSFDYTGVYQPSTGTSDFSGTSQNASPHFHSSPGLLNPQQIASAPTAYTTRSAPAKKKRKANFDKKQPAWTDTKTKAGKDRKRLPLACIGCRKKKVRCSGETPSCAHCNRSRIPCVYRATPRKASPRFDYMAMLDKRIRRMEERLNKTMPKFSRGKRQVLRGLLKPGQRTVPTMTSTIESSQQALRAFDKDSFKHKHPFAKSQSIGDTDEDDYRPSIMVEGRESLPSRDIQECLVDTFFDYVYGQAYLIIHRPTFLRKFAAGATPPVILLAMCAVSARFAEHSEITGEPRFLRGQKWAKAARKIVLRRFDEPDITILIALIVLCLDDFGCCNGGRSWMFGGMAIRMAFALNLHYDLEVEPPSTSAHIAAKHIDREQRRRLLWSCFLLDRFTSSGTGRPIFISESWLHTPLPIAEDNFNRAIPGTTEHLDMDKTINSSGEGGEKPKHSMGIAAFMIRAIALWARVIQYFNSGGRESEKVPIWDPGSNFTALRKAIEDFKTNLPPELLLTAENIRRHRVEKIANQLLFMHVAYYQTYLFLHQWAIPDSPQWRPDPQMPKAFFHAGGKRVFEAAGRVSEILEMSEVHRLVAPFVGYAAVFSGTVHIFGIYQKTEKLRVVSKSHLRINLEYLKRNKSFWGPFGYLLNTLKDVFARFQGSGTSGSIVSPSIIQYADWFNHYPRGYGEGPRTDPHADLLDKKAKPQTMEEYIKECPPEVHLRTPTKRTQKKVMPPKITRRKDLPVKTETPIEPDTVMAEYQPFPTSNFTSNFPTPPQISMPTELTMGGELAFSPNYAFGSDTTTQMPMASSSHQDFLPQVERQMVYNAYGEANPMAAATNMPMSTGVQLDDAWMLDQGNGQLQGQGANHPDANTGSWFIPFNYQPSAWGQPGPNY